MLLAATIVASQADAEVSQNFASRVASYKSDIKADIKAAERGVDGTRRAQSVEELLRLGVAVGNRMAAALEGLLDVYRWKVSLDARLLACDYYTNQLLVQVRAVRRGGGE